MTSGRGSHTEARLVFLVGFMGAGKSSVGRELGRRLGWRFEDLDECIQSREGRSIEEIFRQSGEAEFRRIEHLTLRDLHQSMSLSQGIVALGGGTFAQPQNLELLSTNQAITIFLDADVEELLRRCKADEAHRPLFRDESSFRRLYESRRASYLRAALCIETGGKDVETVVDEIQRGLRFQLRLDSGGEQK
jgi:shikimate kinase